MFYCSVNLTFFDYNKKHLPLVHLKNKSLFGYNKLALASRDLQMGVLQLQRVYNLLHRLHLVGEI